jgi:putative restriction endonuclease
MTDLTISIKQFASLNRAPGATWSKATKRKAPRKNAIMKDEL